MYFYVYSTYIVVWGSFLNAPLPSDARPNLDPVRPQLQLGSYQPCPPAAINQHALPRTSTTIQRLPVQPQSNCVARNRKTSYSPSAPAPGPATTMALDTFFHNKIESMKLEIIQGQAKLRRLEAQRNDYNSRVRLLREELGLLQQPGSYVGEVVKVMGTKKVLVKVHPEGKYGTYCPPP